MLCQLHSLACAALSDLSVPATHLARLTRPSTCLGVMSRWCEEPSADASNLALASTKRGDVDRRAVPTKSEVMLQKNQVDLRSQWVAACTVSPAPQAHPRCGFEIVYTW